MREKKVVGKPRLSYSGDESSPHAEGRQLSGAASKGYSFNNLASSVKGAKLSKKKEHLRRMNCEKLSASGQTPPIAADRIASHDEGSLDPGTLQYLKKSRLLCQ